MEKGPEITTIDAYIAQYEPEAQARMQAIRQTVHEIAPEAQERMSWQMPTFWLQGNLIHFAMNKAHIGLYPGSEAVARFQDKLGDYRTTKGGIQLPMNRPLPLDLIREITLFCLAENLAEAERKAAKKKAGKKDGGAEQG